MYSNVFSILMYLSLFPDAWAAWAQGGSATGTKSTTNASQAKMNQSQICLKWVILPPIYQPDRSQEEFMISVSYKPKPPTQSRPGCKKEKFSFNNLSPDWLGKSSHVVNHRAVTMSVSQLQCAEMLKPAIKSQEVLPLQTHNRIMWYFKAPMTCSKVSLSARYLRMSERVYSLCLNVCKELLLYFFE